LKEMEMDPIKIQTGQVRVPVEVDGKIVTELSFNPSDVCFAERFFGVYRELQALQQEFEKRDQELAQDQEADDNGVPKNAEARIALQKQVIQAMYGHVDSLFGQGTSKAIFGDLVLPELVAQLLEGVTPYFQRARSAKVGKYLPPSSKGKSKRIMR